MRTQPTIALLFIALLASQAPGQDWPMWAGPTANWLASPEETGLLGDLSKAKLLWKSEDSAPGGTRGQARRYGCNTGTTPGSGAATPIVYNDKVYFHFLESKGAVSNNIGYDIDPLDVLAECLADQKQLDKGFNEEDFLDLWRIEANDVVLCIDAFTGKTVWKKVFPDGIYHDDWAKPRKANNTPAAGDGKIFFYSSMNVLRAFDAATGNLVWEAWNGPEKEARRREAIDRGNLTEGPSAVLGPPVLFAKGLAIYTHTSSGNYDREKNLEAFDAATGEQKWRVENVGPGQGAPSLWIHKGTTYIVAASQLGNVTCVRASDGTIMWKLTGKAYNGHSIAVAGDYMVINEVGETEKYTPTQPAAYRLEPEGPTHLWTLPPEHGTKNNVSPPLIYREHVYIREYKSDQKIYNVLCVELASGKIVSSAPGSSVSNGFMVIADDKLYI